jgi:hypothetical protein
MTTRLSRCTAIALALACALGAGCQDRHQPVKPTVASAASPAR